MRKKNILKLIKEIRKKLDFTQEQFAQKVVVISAIINNYRRENRTPTPFCFGSFWKWLKKLA